MKSDGANAAPADFEAFAVELARAAAEITLPFFRDGTDVDDKDVGGLAFDPVTAADRDAEAVMRRLISQRFPAHGVIGEEYGEDRPEADWVWVLDPIDGTRAFISGLPTWTTLIGLQHAGGPVLGVIAQPFLGETFVGTATGSRLLTGDGRSRPLRTRPCPSLDQSTLATTDPYLFNPDERASWDRMRKAVRLRRYGCDAYAYAMLAAGYLDVVMESGLKLWDWTALVPVIEGAGGRVRDWSGGTPGDGQIIAYGDARLEGEWLRIRE